jgi:phosphatidylserine/phosphatidylglycerophosphate/cardiolipin synthase-like enzyme
MNVTYQHSKVMVNEDAFRIQTANLTKSSFESNREHFFFSTHTGVRESLQQLFEKDWRGESLSSDQLHPNLVVCPLNCRAVIEAMISGAKESIIIQTQYIFDPVLLEILRHQSTKVDLRIIVADTLDNTELVYNF